MSDTQGAADMSNAEAELPAEGDSNAGDATTDGDSNAEGKPNIHC